MEKNNLIVLSFDALSKKDFVIFSQLPNFKRLIEESSYSINVKSINPTLTYACHSSIITGCRPARHGIISNTLLQTNRLDSPDWYWQRKYIKEETLYDLALKNGMTVASLLWPVTAKSKITWNLPEIWANRPWQNQLMMSVLNGTLSYQLELNNKFGHIRNGKSQPELDDFTIESLIHTLDKYQPNLILAHFIDLDTMRHHHGHDSKEAVEAIHRLDRRLGQLISYLDEKGTYQSTNLVVLGDHAQIPVNSVVSLNLLFKEEGLLISDSRMINDWQVISKANDGSAYIYVKNKNDMDKVGQLLQKVKEKYGFVKKILQKEEIISRGMDNNADFVVDANEGFYFTDRIEKDIVNSVFDQNGKLRDGFIQSSHGFLIDHEDYETVFFAKGPGIKKNYLIKDMSLLDEASTFAKILGLEMKGTDGKLLEEIFIV